MTVGNQKLIVRVVDRLTGSSDTAVDNVNPPTPSAKAHSAALIVLLGLQPAVAAVAILAGGASVVSTALLLMLPPMVVIRVVVRPYLRASHVPPKPASPSWRRVGSWLAVLLSTPLFATAWVHRHWGLAALAIAFVVVSLGRLHLRRKA